MFIRLWLYKKNHYRLIPVDLSKQKELDVDPKAIQQIEFVGRLKKLGAGSNVGYMFILAILQKIEKMRLTSFQGSVTVL